MAEESLFATLYILAQAIERFLEYFSESSFLGRDKIEIDESGGKIKNWQNIIDKLIEKEPLHSNLQGIVDSYQEKIEEQEKAIRPMKSKRIIVLWMYASVLGIFLCWIFKIGFLKTIGATSPWETLDYIVSGIVIGSGTKPLHDIIAKIETVAKK